MKKLTFLSSLLLLAVCARSQNAWVQKADFPGTARNGAVGFATLSKGYIAMGNDGSVLYNDVWEWDPVTNAWTQKASHPGAGRIFCSAFSIGNKGYIYGGRDLSNTDYADLYEYDPIANTWTAKASLPAAGRYYAVGFSIGTKGYIGVGSTTTTYLQDFWEWDQATDSWSQKANYPGSGRFGLIGFGANGKAYVGLGCNNSSTAASFSDFWEFDPSSNAWTAKTSFPGTARYRATQFVLGNTGYVGLGRINSSTPVNDFYAYNPLSDSWSSIASFGGASRSEPASFAISGKGYVGTGYDAAPSRRVDFWEYSPLDVGMKENTALLSSSVYPNPFHSTAVFMLETSEHIAGASLIITDVEGRTASVMTGINSNRIGLDRNELAAGTYFYTCTMGNKILAKGKLVIQ